MAGTMTRPIHERVLESGARYSQAEFHALYEHAPAREKWELIGGRAYRASPLGVVHGEAQPKFSCVLSIFAAKTPGVRLLESVTTILGRDSEVQPDLSVLIEPAAGGRTKQRGLYIDGGPELAVEIAYSSASIDLGDKKLDYFRAGVEEYAVLVLRERWLAWFRLQEDRELEPDSVGVIRSIVFPGLWVHGGALIDGDLDRALATLELGLASPEHGRFVAELALRRGA